MAFQAVSYRGLHIHLLPFHSSISNAHIPLDQKRKEKIIYHSLDLSFKILGHRYHSDAATQRQGG